MLSSIQLNTHKKSEKGVDIDMRAEQFQISPHLSSQYAFFQRIKALWIQMHPSMTMIHVLHT